MLTYWSQWKAVDILFLKTDKSKMCSKENKLQLMMSKLTQPWKRNSAKFHFVKPFAFVCQSFCIETAVEAARCCQLTSKRRSMKTAKQKTDATTQTKKAQVKRQNRQTRWMKTDKYTLAAGC